MLSERLRIAIKEAGMSQAELVRACRVKPSSVNGWLSGKSKFLRGENLLAAARVLNVSEVWLATGDALMHTPLRTKAASFVLQDAREGVGTPTEDKFTLVPQLDIVAAC